MSKSNGRREKPGFGIFIIPLTHMFAHVYDRIFPALIPVFRDEFNLSLTELGIIASIPALFQVLFSIPSGYLADRIGYRKTMALSFLISICSALAITVSRTTAMLAVSISALGLVATFYHPASYSYTTIMTSEKNRSKALGLHSAGGPLGLALGPISLTFVMGYLNWGWRSVYLLWIIPLLSILAALFKLDSPKGATRDSETISIATKTQNKKDNVKSLLTIGFIMFLVYTAMTSVGDQMISVFLPTYLTDVRKLSVSDASLVYGFASLTGVFAAPAGGYFADKLGRKTWLLYTVAAATICLFLAFLSPTAGVFIVFYFMNSFLTYSGMAASSAIIASLTPRSRRGMGYALSFLPGSLIGSVAPALAGVIGELMGLAFIFPIGIIAYSMALLTLRFGVARDSK